MGLIDSPFVKEINEKFYKNQYFSEKITGQSLNDKCCANDVNPNNYRDVNPKPKFIFYISGSSSSIFPLNPTKKPEKWEKKKKEKTDENKDETVVIKETINIEEEINNIGDLLQIIDMYKYDPSIKYNINMKALHKIKEPLIELNNMIGMKDLKENIIDQILFYIQNLHTLKTEIKGNDFMHTVIYGPPGTGKTEIAKIIGAIFSKMGVLTKGTFICFILLKPSLSFFAFSILFFVNKSILFSCSNPIAA
jgi:hypothetical protein